MDWSRKKPSKVSSQPNCAYKGDELKGEINREKNGDKKW